METKSLKAEMNDFREELVSLVKTKDKMLAQIKIAEL